jgi:hypothetical protein
MVNNTNTVPIGFKAMEQQHNSKLWGIIPAIAGGMGNYLLQINQSPYLTQLFKAGLTALVCGFIGAAGKWLWDYSVKKLLKHKK